MRGDRPLKWIREYVEKKFTPHARGSTFCQSYLLRMFLVYPACAGIDRSRLPQAAGWQSLPRMRGDRPLWKDYY